MRRLLLVATIASALFPSPAWAQKPQTISGYAEWQKGSVLVVDGQRVTIDGGTRFDGDATSDLASFPLGAEVKVQGVRQADGVLVARRIEAKRNSVGLLERDVRQAADEAERQWLVARAIEDPDDPTAGGRILERGRRVDRVRGIVDRLVPPYLRPSEFRVYVVENEDWNAFAMANGSIWVYTGLLDDMDDDELAVVVGHELAHVTHEHSRRDYKKSLWVSGIAAVAALASEQIEGPKTRLAAQAATLATALAVQGRHGRQSEDQADRVGLRYAFEGGFDTTTAPRVWQRFEDKYGGGNRVVNFFLSEHSRAPVRRAHLEEQIRWNYAPGADVPARGYTPRRD